jgi:hypothetical protein
MINARFVKEMDNHFESSVLTICHWLKEPDITLSDMIVPDKVTQIKVAPTCIRHARWPDLQFALPGSFFHRHLEYDICIFTWKVLECIILAYNLIKKRDSM